MRRSFAAFEPARCVWPVAWELLSSEQVNRMTTVIRFPRAPAGGAKCNRAREARENERARETARRADAAAPSSPAMGPALRDLLLEELLPQRMAVERLRIEHSITARLLRERLLLEPALAARALVVVDSAARPARTRT